MRVLKVACVVLALAFSATPALANHSEVNAAIPGAQRVGEARYNLLTIPLFHAELWTANGAFSWDRNFALTLTYDRAITSRALLSRTVTEMTQRGAGDAASLAPFVDRLRPCFPDVARGDRITGVSTGANTARFYLNGAQRCEVEWPGLRRNFFGIWLDARGGQRGMSERLRGAS